MWKLIKLDIRSRTKNQTPSAVRNPTPPKNLRLRNPECRRDVFAITLSWLKILLYKDWQLVVVLFMFGTKLWFYPFKAWVKHEVVHISAKHASHQDSTSKLDILCSQITQYWWINCSIFWRRGGTLTPSYSCSVRFLQFSSRIRQLHRGIYVTQMLHTASAANCNKSRSCKPFDLQNSSIGRTCKNAVWISLNFKGFVSQLWPVVLAADKSSHEIDVRLTVFQT